MGILIGFAFLAGIITVLSPCVLPVLPVVLSGSVAGGRLRPLGIISGFLASFTIVTLALTFLIRAFGISPDVLRYVAAATIIALAVILMVPALKVRFMSLASSLLSKRQGAPRGQPKQGWWPGFVTGLSLGIVWTPCVGPIMASVITLAISQSLDLGAVVITLSYALGTALPLFAVMQGGRTLVKRFPRLTNRLDGIQRLFGALMLLTGIALFTGLDRSFQTWLLRVIPGYGSGLTSIEDNEAVRKALDLRGGSSTSADSPGAVRTIPDRSGIDPLSRTSGAWFNSQALTLEGLKGKVVLVDFWTYSCINCLRTMPYLKAWQARYADQGLVIVGVHSPEFAFEQDAGNLKAAIDSLGISWPVVQDNGFGIWNSFSNQYWPAHYLFDRDGTLVDTHFGEGAYAETERKIQALLGKTSATLESDGSKEGSWSPDRNPETYLGSARGQKSIPGGSPGPFGWTLEGTWHRDAEYVELGEGASLRLDFKAREIFLVVSAMEGAKASIQVLVDGQPVSTKDVSNGSMSISGSRLYQVFGAGEARHGVLTLKASGKARLHAFTFS